MPINTSVAAMGRSRVWKLLVALGGAAVIASVGISGCHDQPLPMEALALTPPEPSLSRYPTEEEYAEMPAEFRTGPSILAAWVDAGFVGNRAYGRGWMQYFANYAKITLPVTLIYDNRQVTSTTGYSELSSVLPAVREMEAYASLGVSGSCGNTVNASGIFFVRHQIPISRGWFQWGEETATDGGTKSQPACSCGGATSLQDAAYDPYAGDGPESPCADGGSSGGTSGSGTQFSPGSYTGGETVDWNTGIGNGGGSACGADAVVEYVCIDVWNSETERWDEWGCGYVTMC
ncbi:MAG: hypothetical protein H0W42_03495 [Gemmatimonadaceae bacterium]|nr:hypothetical protein [Gemmatimonadaceae bacterium]